MRVLKERPRAGAAADQQCQVQTTGWSFSGSAGLLLVADMAHATIITATMSIYAPRANLPIMVRLPWLLVSIAKGSLRGRLSLIFG
jgi:hypothetical protein